MKLGTSLGTWGKEEARELSKHGQLLWALPKEQGLQRELYLKIDSAYILRQGAGWVTGRWQLAWMAEAGPVEWGERGLELMRCHHFRIVNLNQALKSGQATQRLQQRWAAKVCFYFTYDLSWWQMGSQSSLKHRGPSDAQDRAGQSYVTSQWCSRLPKSGQQICQI